MVKILIVEDDKHIAKMIETTLMMGNYTSELCPDGAQAVEMIQKNHYDLILLDVMLPHLDGFEVLTQIQDEHIPVIFLTALQEVTDKVKGLRLGAEDYIVKPFSPSELVARVIAHISRYQRLTAKDVHKAPDTEILETENLKLDANSRRAYVDGTEISLTNKEFDLLYFLAKSPDTVYSKDTLFNEIWHYDSIGETSTVTVHVNRIRDKIKEANNNLDYIHTVWGKGYRFNK